MTISWVFALITLGAVGMATFVSDLRRAVLSLWVAGLGIGAIYLTLGAELLAVVRGLEALQQPSRVTLVTPSRYVARGIVRCLDDWRASQWQWERFGRVEPIRDHDLWRRVDRAMDYHQIDCHTWPMTDAAPLPAPDAAIAAHARTLVDWHARHRHCAACGGHTRSVQGGANRVCFDCQAEHFPRTDPVAIAVVVRGDQCLLGRGPGWPATFFSALAGFVEAGESLEDAVRREVLEEAGVRVGSVRYVASQPWPFPAALMLGFEAEASSDAIAVGGELADARWFRAAEMRDLIAQGELIVSPQLSIAYFLIDRWYREETGEPLTPGPVWTTR